MLNPKRLYLYHLLSILLPETSCFALKRAFLRWCGAEIAAGVRICSSAFFLGAGRLSIGEDTWIGHEVFISVSGQICIGKQVDLAPRVCLETGTHIPDFEGPRCAGEGITGEIRIGDGCWIGAGVTILPGVEVGAHTIVGAGALVNRSLPGRITAVGVPAKVLQK